MVSSYGLLRTESCILRKMSHFHGSIWITTFCKSVPFSLAIFPVSFPHNFKWYFQVKKPTPRTANLAVLHVHPPATCGLFWESSFGEEKRSLFPYHYLQHALSVMLSMSRQVEKYVFKQYKVCWSFTRSSKAGHCLLCSAGMKQHLRGEAVLSPSDSLGELWELSCLTHEQTRKS